MGPLLRYYGPQMGMRYFTLLLILSVLILL